MTKQKPHSQGAKTVEQRKRMLENKDDLPREDDDGNQVQSDERETHHLDASKRNSEFAVSRGGMNQEDRRHNKPHA